MPTTNDQPTSQPHQTPGSQRTRTYALDRIAIDVRSHRLLRKLLEENRPLEQILRDARNETEALVGVKQWVQELLAQNPAAEAYYRGDVAGREAFEQLQWRDYAAIRILDYIENAGREFADLNLRGEPAVSNPIKLIWLAVTHGTGGAKPAFFEDMLHLFRQLRGAEDRRLPDAEHLATWTERFPSGLDPRIVRLREENRDRIIADVIERIEAMGESAGKYALSPELSPEQKYLQVLDWWKDWQFHLKFAVRAPRELNNALGESLDPDTMKVLEDAEQAGIPFFVNPYYLSLLHVRVPYFAIGADLAIRHYVVYSRQLVEEFGDIVAWEKEDIVEPGKPNAAGWLLPSHHNVHRRYPEVAILIPDTVGRACGGLCASCQRMYDFQRGNLNFNLDKLRPDESWDERLARLMDYFEQDAQLRDILVTGGDALMSSDRSLKTILDAIADMAGRKREANRGRKDGEKHAELVRVRLGTRLPVYLPQRITPELCEILAGFKQRAAALGVRQFIIQTHFESPLEVTPEARDGVRRLLDAGWTVTNQLVFTTAASRRGHTAKLRQVLGEIGVLPYYTFSVKGYMENNFNFATNARAVQEQIEEKAAGTVPADAYPELVTLPDDPAAIPDRLADLRRRLGLPFLATDRNVLNLPGVGKSLTYRVIGITRYGRRILEFDHDANRTHSPIIEKLGKIVIIESKSIREYLAQLEAMGEDVSEYASLWGYSVGETEPRLPLYEYPEYGFAVTDEMTNLEV
ncbi:KamA family protein [bacterium]|nr:KamA family protein [bacterium]